MDTNNNEILNNGVDNNTEVVNTTDNYTDAVPSDNVEAPTVEENIDLTNEYPEAVTDINEPPVENIETDNMLPPETDTVDVEYNYKQEQEQAEQIGNNKNTEVTIDNINAEEISPDQIIDENYVDEDYQDYDYNDEQLNLNKSINNHVNIVSNYNNTEDVSFDDTESTSSYEEQLNNSEDISFDSQGTSQYQEMQDNYVDSSSYDGMYNQEPVIEDNQYYDNYEQPYNQGYDNYNQPPMDYNQGYDNYEQPYNQGYDNYNQPPMDYNQGYDNYEQPYNQGYDNYNQPYDQGYDNYNQPPMDYGQTNNTFINTQVEPEPSFINTTYEPSNDVQIERPSYKPKYGFDKKEKKQSKIYNFGLVLIYLIIFGVIGFIVYSLWVDRSTFYFKKDKINILRGSTFEEKVLVKGKEDDPEKYTWSSENNNIATVDNKGIITAKGEGSTNIVATNKKTKKSNIISVNVVNVNIKTFAIKPSSKVAIIGKTYTLNPSINGQSSIIVNYIWKSADPSIVTVNEHGEIKALKRGHTTVTAYIPNTKFYSSVSVNAITN